VLVQVGISPQIAGVVCLLTTGVINYYTVSGAMDKDKNKHEGQKGFRKRV
jgi:hypothetical protein